MPPKCRAIAAISSIVHAALHDRVDLDRREAGVARRVDAAKHAMHGKVDVVHRAEGRVVERIDAHGEPAQAGGAERAASFREARAIGREREIAQAIDARRACDERREFAPQQRLAAGEPHLFHARARRRCAASRAISSKVRSSSFGRKSWPWPKTSLRHAVAAAEVAAVRDRDAQIAERTSKRIVKRGWHGDFTPTSGGRRPQGPRWHLRCFSGGMLFLAKAPDYSRVLMCSPHCKLPMVIFFSVWQRRRCMN